MGMGAAPGVVPTSQAGAAVCGGSCGAAACGCDDNGVPMMSYQGNGAGEYIATTTYQYVGRGCGEYNAIMVPTRTTNYIICIIPLLSLLGLLCWWLLSNTNTATTTTT